MVETPSKELLKPTLDWKGVTQTIQTSLRSEVGIAVNQLRDPDIFKDNNGSLYILYTGAGEQGIGIVKLHKE